MKTEKWLLWIAVAISSLGPLGCVDKINVQLIGKPAIAGAWEVEKAVCTEWPLAKDAAKEKNCDSSASNYGNQEFEPYGTDRLMTSVDVSQTYQLLRFKTKKQSTGEPACGAMLVLACPGAVNKYPSVTALEIEVPENAFKHQAQPEIRLYCDGQNRAMTTSEQVDLDDPEKVCTQLKCGGKALTHVLIVPALIPNSALEHALQCR